MARACRNTPESFVMVATRALLALGLLLPLLAQASSPRTLLVMGDSLSAAYGLAAEQGWVSLMGEKLARERPGWQVVNASISGETTAGGASRIDGELARHRPDAVLIELGANDGLRGLPLDVARANLERMVTAAKAQGASVGLIGMRMPPNYGPDYTAAFDAMYRDLAERHALPLLPFLLEPIAAERDAFLQDNLHPTAEAQPRLLEHAWPVALALIENAEGEATAAKP